MSPDRRQRARPRLRLARRRSFEIVTETDAFTSPIVPRSCRREGGFASGIPAFPSLAVSLRRTDRAEEDTPDVRLPRGTWLAHYTATEESVEGNTGDRWAEPVYCRSAQLAARARAKLPQSSSYQPHSGLRQLLVVEGRGSERPLNCKRLETPLRRGPTNLRRPRLRARAGVLVRRRAPTLRAPLAQLPEDERAELPRGRELAFRSSSLPGLHRTPPASLAMLHKPLLLTTNVASRRSVLLVVDDLHWRLAVLALARPPCRGSRTRGHRRRPTTHGAGEIRRCSPRSCRILQRPSSSRLPERPGCVRARASGPVYGVTTLL
jgi:hypothetical protein